MTDQGAGSAHESASAAELVLDVKELAEHLAVHLARVGDANDLGRAACVCKALHAACASERAWELACTARLPTAVAARESLSGAAASGFSWRRHFAERVRGGACASAELRTSLADAALLLVDVWHNGTLAFTASLTPAADERLEDECYSDSDDFDFDTTCTEWKAEFAIENEACDPAHPYGRHRSPTFVDAGRLRASAWLLRRDGELERVMCRAPAELDSVTEGSVAWAGTRRVVFDDGARPGVAVRLHLAGWLVEEKTSYRWWPDQGARPPRSDLRRITRMCVRWEPATER
jgi:hypothetical protein